MGETESTIGTAQDQAIRKIILKINYEGIN